MFLTKEGTMRGKVARKLRKEFYPNFSHRSKDKYDIKKRKDGVGVCIVNKSKNMYNRAKRRYYEGTLNLSN